MKKVSKRLLATAGILAGSGLVLLLAGSALGGPAELRSATGLHQGNTDISEHTIQIDREGGVRIDEGGIDIGGDTHHAEDLLYTHSCSLEGMTDMDVDLSLGDITVSEGDRFSLALSWPGDTCALRYSFSDGKLRVWSEEAAWGKLADALSGCRVDITLPADTTLRDVDLSTDLGSVTWSVSAVCRKAELSTDLGDATCSALSADELSCKTDMGDVTVSLPKAWDEYRWKLETDMGNVKVDGETKNGGMGTIKHEGGSGRKSIEAASKWGNVGLDLS